MVYNTSSFLCHNYSDRKMSDCQLSSKVVNGSESFLSACIWRTELTSPAVKSFMTLQRCGPHSARPASTNQCLHSDTQHARRPVHPCRSCAKKPASADINYKCSFRQAHRFTSTQVSQHLFVSHWSCSCFAHPYPLLVSQAAFIY